MKKSENFKQIPYNILLGFDSHNTGAACLEYF